jgi:transcriptional regulator with XRE-family HTH domain
VATAGGPETFDAAVTAVMDDARGWRLAEMRNRRGMTQEQVAARMGVPVVRVLQIERGDVSTQDVLNRYVLALGGAAVPKGSGVRAGWACRLESYIESADWARLLGGRAARAVQLVMLTVCCLCLAGWGGRWRRGIQRSGRGVRGAGSGRLLARW